LTAVNTLISRYKYLISRIGNGRIYLILFGFIVGCVLANEVDILVYNKIILFVLVIFGLLYPRYLLVLIFLCLGIARVHFANSQTNHISNYTDNQVKLTATVRAYPYAKGTDKVLILKPHNISFSNKNIEIKGGLIQTKVSKFTNINKGDLVTLEMWLEQPENFLEFDYVEYLKSNNIYATGKNVRILEIEKNSNRFESVINNLRITTISKINKAFPDPHAKLLAGMLIGTREQFSSSFANNLSISGTTHVVAVSGYNISLIINSIMTVAGYINRKTLIYTSYAGLIGFILIVGIDNIPALRATLMGFALLAGMVKGRRSSGLFILLLVAVVMHIQNPFTYKSLSFQLSFAATLGLMMLSSHLSKITGKFIPKSLNDDLGSTLTAILVTFPVTFANFGKITTYALPANILIAPLIPMISFSGIIWLVVSAVNNPAAKLLEGFVWGCLEIMVKMVNLIASFPYADLTYSQNLNQLALIVVGIIIVILFEFSYREFNQKNV